MTVQHINAAAYRVPVDGFTHVTVGPRGGVPVEVAGLTSRNAAGEVVGPGDPAAQAEQIFIQLTEILAAAGTDLDAVMRIRTFTTDIALWPHIEGELRKRWPDRWPVSTFVEVSRLYDPQHLFEIEATAFLH